MFAEFAQACQLLLFVVPAMWGAMIFLAIAIIFKAIKDAH